MKETLKISMRACRIFAHYQPGFFPWMSASKILDAVFPYAGIFFSARIIGILAGSRNPEQLIFWVLTTLCVTAVLGLLKALCLERYRAEDKMRWGTCERIYAHKRLRMDYPDAVSQETQGLLDHIVQLSYYNGLGFNRLAGEIIPKFIESAASILSGVALTFGLFLSPVKDSSWKFLDSPLMPVVLLGIMLATAKLTGSIVTTANNRLMEENDRSRQLNRMFSYFSGKVYNGPGAGLDMRLYDQQPLCGKYFNGKEVASGMFYPIMRVFHRYVAPMEGLAAVIEASFIFFAYLFVCLKAWAGAFGIDSVSQYVGAVTAMAGGIAALFQLTGLLRTNSAALETLFSYLDIPNAMYQGSLTTEKRADRKYEVEFRNVSFQYPGTDIWALRHVSFRFKIGSRMAVVGENGSGKTTFIKLLCRLYDPTEGEILLNGIDIRKYRYKDYMDIFSVVFQDFRLPAYTLAEAVAAGRKVDRRRVTECLMRAGFEERLLAMPKGLDTMLYKELDKEGIEISGGEAQKIAIARTLYKDAPFLILDEPTAALDPRAEAEIYEKFNDIAGDKTVVYISHRLSSCKFCDEITVFDHGQVVQQGTHEELLAGENGKYYELWNAQAQYYTE